MWGDAASILSVCVRRRFPVEALIASLALILSLVKAVAADGPLQWDNRQTDGAKQCTPVSLPLHKQIDENAMSVAKSLMTD